MARNLRDYIASLPKHRQEAINRETKRLLDQEARLQDIRKAREISQRLVGEKLSTNQSGVSKIESQDDMRVSTLRSYIEALGGKVDFVARFPDQDPIRISQFDSFASE